MEHGEIVRARHGEFARHEILVKIEKRRKANGMRAQEARITSALVHVERTKRAV